MGELLAPARAIPLLAGEIACARSALAILRRRAADDRFEVIDQMGLIKVSEFQRNLSELKLLAAIDPFDEFVQTVTANHPFWVDADILVEDPLQRTLADAALLHEVIYGPDLAGFKNLPD